MMIWGCLTSVVSRSSFAAGGGAVSDVLEVCDLHGGVGAEALFKPLHQSLHRLLLWVHHCGTNDKKHIHR